MVLARLPHRCQVVNLRYCGLLHPLKVLLNLLACPRCRLFRLLLDLLVLDVECRARHTLELNFFVILLVLQGVARQKHHVSLVI